MQRSRGFSLVEVMVALVIVAIGLLGLAKMESLALSSTTVASGRQLAAIEASSMASMMHANRAYWGSSVAKNVTTITSGTTAPSALCTSAGACTTPTAVALYDEYQWSQSLNSVLPNYLATITCTNSGLPITCTITITWGEAAVAVDPTRQTAMSNLNAPTYTVFVEP